MRRVLITGGSRGIGREVSLLFARRGDHVLINCGHNAEAAEQLACQLRGEGYLASSMLADITQEKPVVDLFCRVEQQWGPIDVLINNAGISQIKMIQDISAQDWDEMMAVHLRGMFLCSREAAKQMIPRKQGKIVNVSSMWGIAGASCETHYSAAKAGMIGFTKALAKELAPSGVQVNAVAPGVVETDMMKDFRESERLCILEEIPLGRFTKPEEIAEIIYFLCAKESESITGQVISPNGGMVM